MKRNAIPFAVFAAFAATAAQADVVHLDDVIIDGSLCVGFDCVNGESFGFDTIRLKENNLRIKFQDTSASASFPSNDWQLIANQSSNGGQNLFSIEDVDAGNSPFTIVAGAGANSIYVNASGRVGFGTASPAVELHARDGDTPTLRLEQDGSSGFTAQTWDVAGNETNFFVRDASNGSTLPLRIRPGAPTSALDLNANGELGIGTTSPDEKLHVQDGNLKLEQNGNVSFTLANTADTTNDFRFQLNNSARLSFVSSGVIEMEIVEGGDVRIAGNIFSAGTQLAVPDYVFAPDYELMPLSQVKAFIDENSHLPRIPSAADIARDGINMSQMQMSLLEKVEELTLYTLAQEDRIAELTERLRQLEN